MRSSVRLVAIVSALVCLPAGEAGATVSSFQGAARIELHERLVAGDPDAIDTTVVDLEMQLYGLDSPRSAGVGSATISSPGRLVTILLTANQMSPPEGGGGRALAAGIGDDGYGYCFDIHDLADAPTPREDRIIAAFGPLEWMLPGQHPYGLIVSTHCSDLLYLEDDVLDGGFTFSALI
jgi:hypothetical protein